ncbi:SH3 domain-binding glutamic acid-rich-like protein 3 [Ostrea edulis]|uniref:SH3 domain-binding glutamic acid-rich-like protein 3 n=1 Tax=Ostrea edulis TaxID=37623 RepID=UPI0020962577|nr:SH3 domain-binding glutamic acid-rich-like protein 3 [Ostrea edulis]
MTIKFYMTTVATNREIYIKQNRIKLILDGKKIPYEEIDLSKNQEVREEMRARAGIPDLLPPQIFNGDTYCGDFQAFDDANEDGRLLEFLQLK